MPNDTQAASLAQNKPVHVSTKREFQTNVSIITGATFLITGLTGLMVFFHVGSRSFMGIHEWVGIAFLIVSLFHVAIHFDRIVHIFTKTRTGIVFGLISIIIVAYILWSLVGSGFDGGLGRGGGHFGRRW